MNIIRLCYKEFKCALPLRFPQLTFRLSAVWHPLLCVTCFWAVFFLAAGPPPADAAQQASAIQATRKNTRPSLEEMVGQMLLVGFRGTGQEPLTRGEILLLEDIQAGRVGGVILFDRDATTKTADRNILSVAQVKSMTDRLQRAAAIPLFIGIDQEGGMVQRFKAEHGIAATPSPASMGQRSPQSTKDTAKALGLALQQAGVNLDFAPSLDVNINPNSPAIGALGRSFSTDVTTVTEHGRAFAQGLQEAGVLACYKHFPGHGSARSDTHLGLVDITDTWQPSELAPYAELLKDNPSVMVMVAHVVHRQLDAKLPASLSKSIIQGLLRRKLNWKGVVVTDDLQMGAIETQHSKEEALRLTILAGVDILLLGNNLRHDEQEARNAHATIVRLVRSGDIPQKRIVESYKRIMRLKKELVQSRGHCKMASADAPADARKRAARRVFISKQLLL